MSNIENITHLIFDWGDTLMVDDPAQDGAMAFWDDVRACEGVAELLPLLSAKYTCAVASNAADSDAGLMKKAFERVGLAEYLACFVTSKELGAKKPTPEFFIKATQASGVNSNNCAMIGNSYTSDICGAKEVGMTTVLITLDPGEYPLADYVVESFENLAEVFDQQLTSDEQTREYEPVWVDLREALTANSTIPWRERDVIVLKQLLEGK
jgi:putative hydrolase of the HAD superfamily